MIRDQQFVNKIQEKFNIDKDLSDSSKVKSNTVSGEKTNISEDLSILDIYDTSLRDTVKKEELTDEENYFVYKGDDYFQNSIQGYKSMKINIIFFSIYVHNHIPFVMFLMYKYPEASKEYNELITFPHFISTKEIEKEVEEKERLIFKSYDPLKNFKYLKEKNEVYVLCQQSINDYDMNLDRNSSWWWCSPFELINLKKVLGFTVDDKIVDFLFKYDKLMYVYNHLDNLFETPCIGYKIVNEDDFVFELEIGNHLSDDNYYITYEGVFDYIKQFLDSKKIKLIRYIIFLHKFKVSMESDKKFVPNFKSKQSIIVNSETNKYSKIYVLNDFQLLPLSNHTILKDNIEEQENII